MTLLDVVYDSAHAPTRAELVALYASVGWSAYTRDPDRLVAAVEASLRLVTARQDGALIGLARVVGDGLTIVYLQDLLVAPGSQRRGVGRELFRRALAPYDDVRQKVLLTDDDPSLRAFYEAMAFTEAGELDPPVRTFVRFG